MWRKTTFKDNQAPPKMDLLLWKVWNTVVKSLIDSVIFLFFKSACKVAMKQKYFFSVLHHMVACEFFPSQFWLYLKNKNKNSC